MRTIEPLTIHFGGDFCPIGSLTTLLAAGRLNEESCVGSLRTLFAGGDLTVVNLECPLSTRGTRTCKTGPNLRAHPDMVSLLSHAGVSCVTLANNHILDYGAGALVDTMEACASNTIRTVGAGPTLCDARKALHVVLKGHRCAFINVTEHEFSCATSAQGGANPLDVTELTRNIRLCATSADHIIVIVHGGLEHTHCPSPESIRLLRFIAEQDGVSAVIRHHPHVVQGWEEWQGVPIVYSLGNLLFDRPGHRQSGWYEGMIAELALHQNGVTKIVFHPIEQCLKKPAVQVLNGGQKEHALLKMRQYSELLQNESKYSRAWAEVLEQRRYKYLSSLVIPFPLLRRVLRKLRVLQWFRPRGARARYLCNLVRCEAHREVLQSLLENESSQVPRSDTQP